MPQTPRKGKGGKGIIRKGKGKTGKEKEGMEREDRLCNLLTKSGIM